MSAKLLLSLFLLAALLGAVVMIVDKNYRRPINTVSNRNFYSILSQQK